MEKVPLAQRALVVINNREAFSVQDEKVLLHRFGVVAASRLARLHDLDVDASVRPGHAIGLELDEGGSSRSTDRQCIREIDQEQLVDGPTILIAPSRQPNYSPDPL
jgi:hypothetical protein